MGQVNVVIAGRNYRMACDDGQEEHLTALAARLDGKIGELRRDFGEIGDQRITVMAALTIADTLAEAEGRAAALEIELAALRARDGEADGRATALGDAVAERLGEVATRIERIVRRLDASGRS